MTDKTDSTKPSCSERLDALEEATVRLIDETEMLESIVVNLNDDIRFLSEYLEIDPDERAEWQKLNDAKLSD